MTFIKKNQESFPVLSFTVKEVGDAVICVRKLDDLDSLADVVSEYGNPISVATLEEVIGAVLTHKDTALFFPNFIPTEKQLELLNRWGAPIGVVFSTRDTKLFAKRS